MMKCGALDYIVKDSSFLDLLPLAIRRIIREIDSENRRKAAEEALLKSEAKYRILVENLKEAIFTIDENAVLTYVSPSVERIIGYKPEEMIGRLYFDFIHPDDLAEHRNNFEKIRQNGSVEPIEARLVGKDQSVVWVRSNAKAHIEGNRFKSASGTLIDISERKKAEEALQNMQRLKSLGILAGGIAHDFNNLLGGIFGFIELASKTSDNALKNDYLGRALGSIERARALTGQLLTFAKGGDPVKKQEKLIPFIVDAVKFALSGASISCRFNVEDSLWLCEYDKNQIGQVIDNLVINAIQAMPHGGLLEVSVANVTLDKEHASLGPGQYVRISFKDSGVGIDEEVLPHIFDPFFTTRQMGHGLGLSTCYSIISRHNGLIEAESEKGVGSTFYVYLPAVANENAKISSDDTVKSAASGSILIMDDEQILRDMISAMVKMLGYKAVCAVDGAEAVRLFAEDRKNSCSICGLFFDLTIPGGIGGREAISEIRLIDKDIPAFVASGYCDNPVMADPQKYGFTGSVSKPFGLKEISAIISQHISKK